MARLRLDLPATFPFQLELPVRITDLNYGQHVGNDTVLAFLHEARVGFLAAHGYREDDVAGCGMIMLDASVVYRRQMFHGDRLRVEVAVVEVTRTGCEMVYRITREGDGQVTAEARTGMAFYDYAAEKVCRTPAGFRETTTPGA